MTMNQAEREAEVQKLKEERKCQEEKQVVILGAMSISALFALTLASVAGTTAILFDKSFMQSTFVAISVFVGVWALAALLFVLFVLPKYNNTYNTHNKDIEVPLIPSNFNIDVFVNKLKNIDKTTDYKSEKYRGLTSEQIFKEQTKQVLEEWNY